MAGVLSCLPVAYKNIAVANRMKSLREKLTKLRNEIGSFNFIKGSSTTTELPYDERETTSDLPEEPLIGRDGEKQEIIKLLSANTNNDEIVIVPIYGLAGMGKSTLAQLVYNDAQFKMYDHRIWVYVSHDFNLNKIGSSIISQLPSQGGQQNMGIQQVIKQCLENLFHGKEVLIVSAVWFPRPGKHIRSNRAQPKQCTSRHTPMPHVRTLTSLSLDDSFFPRSETLLHLSVSHTHSIGITHGVSVTAQHRSVAGCTARRTTPKILLLLDKYVLGQSQSCILRHHSYVYKYWYVPL